MCWGGGEDTSTKSHRRVPVCCSECIPLSKVMPRGLGGSFGTGQSVDVTEMRCTEPPKKINRLEQSPSNPLCTIRCPKNHRGSPLPQNQCQRSEVQKPTATPPATVCQVPRAAGCVTCVTNSNRNVTMMSLKLATPPEHSTQCPLLLSGQYKDQAFNLVFVSVKTKVRSSDNRCELYSMSVCRSELHLVASVNTYSFRFQNQSENLRFFGCHDQSLLHRAKTK